MVRRKSFRGAIGLLGAPLNRNRASGETSLLAMARFCRILVWSVDVPRPRQRGSAELAALEGAILKNLREGTDDTSDL
jgi:hypothetical protein